eukprot:TRINITY_DN365_c0_g1_i1.p1 TRINITY_DN365_c0_g1~~TRINITY_DN365_c0_g1_i1.p1  ORF type:complete len:510 (-),score=165.01 TRINITY_DN365_c0_g1_i1:73-1572(-)
MADKQLENYAAGHKTPQTLTASNGAPLSSLTASLTAGPHGPQTLSDFNYIDHIAHFDRERIPERVVHAKGGGAFGYFEVTHDITKYTRAEIFGEIGRKTPMAARFSTVGGESGSADTARDPRGFALKFYTKEGNWDLVGNNTPIFFIRDPILFPSFIHTQKRNPKTHLKDANMFWDFAALRPESCHQLSILFSDRGTPDGFRHMHGFGSHTFKLVNKDGEPIYCKFHMHTDQGIKNLSAERAEKLAGENPDYSIEDLYNAIEKGDYPSWSFKIQLMTYEQAEKCSFDPFDVTKVWPHGDYPLIPVGKFVLNKNPENFFAQIEQLAFSPSHMIPGIEPSPDKMLQGRLFSYPDTHRHRLGPNPTLIPVNCPYRARAANYQRDGLGTTDDNQGDAPNYFPNSFHGPQPIESAKWHADKVSGDVKRYETGDEDNFSQTKLFWNKALKTDGERDRLAKNLAGHLSAANPEIQQKVVANFTKCDPAYGKAIQDHLGKIDKRAKI